MVKEYINQLIIENNKKLEDLEKQLKKMMNDQDCAREWLDELHTEANIDKNIFSPRAMDADLERKTDDAQSNIEKIQQDIEHVRSFIEENVKKKLEYEKLLEEIDHMEMESNTDSFSKLLSDLFKKTELCLNYLYSDRVKCKNELKNMRSMIQNMEELLSGDDNPN